MDLKTYVCRFITANLLTLYYSIMVLFGFLVAKLKNPFGDPWAPKLRLEPPACLTDPKYGVHKYIKVNNTKLHYVESGDPTKPLMIFVHGFPEFWYSWRYQITEFNKDYWCVAVDMKGYGDSERPDGLEPYRLDVLVEDLRDLVRQLGRDKCVMVAHDWGGLIACRFRDTHPDALLGLVALASACIEAFNDQMWNNPQQRKKSWYVFFFRMPELPESLLQMNHLAFFEQAMLVEGKDSVDASDIECYKYWFGKALALNTPINYYRANFSYVLPARARREEPVPFLYVLAERDPYLTTALLPGMRANYAHLDAHTMPGCGHFLQQEEPRGVNDLIRGFLKKNSI